MKWTVVLVGARRGVEAQILPQRDFPFHLLPAEPIHRHRFWRNWKLPFVATRLVIRSIAVLRRERPDLVVGTGGYAAGPVLFAAVLLGIPIALQEQNAYPGVTTRLLAAWAHQIHLGFPEARDFLGRRTTAVFDTGNPIAAPASDLDPIAARRCFGFEGPKPTVLVMGGSQGAAAINDAIAQMLDDKLGTAFNLIWSTGPREFEQHRARTSEGSVHVEPFIDPIAQAYAAADLVVGRAGAMSTAEYLAWGLPAILVPLPTAAADHQDKNALALEAAGVALRVPQQELAPERLATTIDDLLSDRSQLDEMRRRAHARARPEAARKIVSQLVEIVS